MPTPTRFNSTITIATLSANTATLCTAMIGKMGSTTYHNVIRRRDCDATWSIMGGRRAALPNPKMGLAHLTG